MSIVLDLHLGDSLEVLKSFSDGSIDSLVTDPPAAIGFMNKSWDSDKGGRDAWINWLQEIMAECLRVLKPGAHGLVWSLPRTSHWTAFACEKAGFEIRDCVTHLFGSGFPKSLDVSKAIDKMAGAEREVIGQRVKLGDKKCYPQNVTQEGQKFKTSEYQTPITAPATSEAKLWQGYGTALKPAAEYWWLIRKPLGEKTVAKNVLEYGTGGLNIDGCRVGNEPVQCQVSSTGSGFNKYDSSSYPGKRVYSNQGRFPANLVLSHHPECEEIGVKEVKAIKGGNNRAIQKNTYNDYGKNYDNTPSGVSCGYGVDGKETVEDWRCHEECAVRMLDRQSGTNCGAAAPVRKKSTPKTTNVENYKPHSTVGDNGASFRGDTGGASRFFYCAKASKRDRGSDNGHPTVKSTKLMEYLIKLVTPPNGVVLDPFMGSGSTGVAATRMGFGFIGIEKEQEYLDIAKKRLDSAAVRGGDD